MMRRGVLTVYLSIVLLLMVSFVLVLLESARVYVIGTMTERYADMAGEMLFSAYVRPLADRYGLFVLDAGEDGAGLRHFEDYLRMNLEKNTSVGSRIFDLHGVIQEMTVGKTVSLNDEDWKSMKSQIERYEKYAMGEKGLQELQNVIGQLTQTDLADVVEDYKDDLSSDGQSMDAALARKAEQDAKDSDNSMNENESVAEPAVPTVTDPRPGISRWLKSGLLELAMGDRSVSNRVIRNGQCSYQASESKKWSIVDRFERYGDVTTALNSQKFPDKLKKGIEEQKTQLIVNLYILDRFHQLCSTEKSGEDHELFALDYEVEYILYGHTSDRENLESAITGIFALRTLLNLVYLYTSQGKGEILENIVDALSVAAVIPVIGQVVKLLLMICWSAAEAVVDCAALADRRKVPLMKNDSSWNLTMSQLLAIGKNGGNAADYVRDGTKGLSYENYLLILLLLTPAEEKMIRMTQLMETNIRLMEGYEDFCFSRCITAAEFEGTVRLLPVFWQHPEALCHHYHVAYGY